MFALQNHGYWKKSDLELSFIISDAGKAAKNMKGFNAKAEGKYLDQVSDACTVLKARAAKKRKAKGYS